MANQYFTAEVTTIDAQGEAVEHHQKQVGYYREHLNPGIVLDLMGVPAGEFIMGAPEQEADREVDEGPQHRVSLPDFWMARYPTTQAQWRVVATWPKVQRDLNTAPANFPGDNHPVENVRWEEAIEFCDRLSQQTGRAYRLPSEAEWEYACRAGTTTPYHFGHTITTDLANYNGTTTYADGPRGLYRATTTDVGLFDGANGFGLYDMHGNVWEWCLDWWHDSYKGAPTDGRAWVTAGDDGYRVLRGGSWGNSPWYCRSANRGRARPDDSSNYFGFRVLCASVASHPMGDNP